MYRCRRKFITYLSLFFGLSTPCLAQWTDLGLSDLGVNSVLVSGQYLYAGTIDGAYRLDISDALSSWESIGLQGHNVRSVLPLDATTILAGLRYDTVAICRTENGGAWWDRSDDGYDGSMINRLDKAPGQSDTIFAAGVGIVRSIDGGLTWDVVREADGASQFVKVDPNQHRTVWVGGEGIFFQPLLSKSLDAGDSWYTLDVAYTGDNNCHDVAVHSHSSSLAWVSMEGQVQATFNGGGQWYLLMFCNLYLYGIEVDPSRPHVIYTSGSQSGEPLTIYKSDDSGFSWTTITEGTHATNGALDVEVYSQASQTSVFLATGHGVFRYDDQKTPVCGNIDGVFGPGGPVDISDLTYLVAYLFTGGPEPASLEVANVDGIVGPAGPVDVSDLTYLVAYLFLGGPAPVC